MEVGRLGIVYKTGWRGLTFEKKFYSLLFLKEMHEVSLRGQAEQ